MNYMAIPGLQKKPHWRDEVRYKLIGADKRLVTTEDIVFVVCRFYEIEVEDLFRQTRKQIYVRPRQVCHYFCNEFRTERSTVMIGKKIGNLHHATVLHSIQLMRDTMNYDRIFRDQMEEMKRQIETCKADKV